VKERALRGPDVVRFLRRLLRHIPGNLLVICDGSPIHRAQVVKDFLAHGAAERLHLEPLPAYAPELNPAEGLWQYHKWCVRRSTPWMWTIELAKHRSSWGGQA
jgi:transposase